MWGVCASSAEGSSPENTGTSPIHDRVDGISQDFVFNTPIPHDLNRSTNVTDALVQIHGEIGQARDVQTSKGAYTEKYEKPYFISTTTKR